MKVQFMGDVLNDGVRERISRDSCVLGCAILTEKETWLDGFRLKKKGVSV
jgi:hypothetical protein